MTSRGGTNRGRAAGSRGAGGRRVNFADDDEILEQAYKEVGEGGSQRERTEGVRESRMKTGKHTLDSDEEDEQEDAGALSDEDIEGQEEGDVDIEEGQRFTPFNMREELEEGHFDADGMYIFQSRKGQIKDSWMDDIDWVKVKQEEKRSGKSSRQPVAMETITDSDDDEEVNESSLYRDMIEIMLPGETVLRAIKRLGGGGKVGGKGGAKQKPQWKRKATGEAALLKMATSEAASSEVSDERPTKRQRLNEVNVETAEPSSENPSTDSVVAEETEEERQKKSLERLVEMANKILSTGNMEIYEYTYEKLSHKLNVGKTGASSSAEPVSQAKDSGLDMFGDDCGASSNDGNSVSDKPTSISASVESNTKETVGDEVRWEYKWEDTDSAPVHGPFTSSQMLDWSEQDYFKDGVFVRKILGSAVSGEGNFYSSRRIDFDLYV